MALAQRIPLPRYSPVFALGAAVVVALVAFHPWTKPFDESGVNFKLQFYTPTGWIAVPHSPQALFLFKHPKTNLLMRGAMSDIVADFNPTPDLDRDGTANWMLDVTSENLTGWSGKMLDTVAANGTSWRLIRRWNPEKCVISAIAVRGNTTLVVTLSADRAQLKSIDGAIPDFKQYLSTLALHKYVYQ